MRRIEVFSEPMKAAPGSVMLISYGLNITMCIMRNFLVILLTFALILSNTFGHSTSRNKITREKSCKVVPLKARPIIKADVIFSGTVLEIIKKPNVVLNFSRKRRRRRRRGKGKIFSQDII